MKLQKALPTQPIEAGRHHPLLQGLEHGAAEAFLAELVVRQGRAGQVLEHHSEQGPSFFLLLRGAVREVLTEPDGREVLVDLIRAPTVLGIEALLGEASLRQFSVIDRAVWLEVPAERVRSIGLSCPELPLRLLRSAAQQLERRQRLLYSLSFEPVRARLARLLAAYVEVFGLPDAEGTLIPIPLSHARLSQDLGVAKRSIDRALEGWVRQRWIIRRGRAFVVRDLERILSSAALDRGPKARP